MTSTPHAAPVCQSDPRAVRLLVGWSILVGTILRLALSAISIGTNDASIWQHIATRVAEVGLLDAYRTEQLMNHPPLPVLWARWALAVSADTWFAFVMKLPAIAADAGSIWLLARIWLGRCDVRRAGLAAIAMALSPVAILISGYHCNTDNVYAFLALLAMYLITDRQRFFLGGLVLAAAINVKLIPVLLIPGALSLCRSRRDLVRLICGLAIGVVPFLPLLAAPEVIRRNMLAYVPPVSEWGIALLLHDIFNHAPFAHTAHALMEAYLSLGRWAILLGVAGLSVASWRQRRWNGYEIGFISFALLLVLAPGFGPQYSVMVVPLLLALSISRAWVYGALAGMFLLLAYASRLTSSSIPFQTIFLPHAPTPPGAPFGLLAWWVLLETMVVLTFRRSTPGGAPMRT